MARKEPRTVWSSEQGDLRKKESQPAKSRTLPANEQIAYLHRETKGRGGKTVTLIKNLVLSEMDSKALAKQLKQACGSGGTVRDGQIEIQGDHRDKISQILRDWGYKVKVAGG